MEKCDKCKQKTGMWNSMYIHHSNYVLCKKCYFDYQKYSENMWQNIIELFLSETENEYM